MAKKKPAKAAAQKGAPRAAAEPKPTAVWSELPHADALYRRGVGLAALTALRGTPRFLRKFRVTHAGPVSLFHLDRGNGDELRFFMTQGGCVVRGFDHESERSPFTVGHVWPGTYAGLPEPLRPWVQRGEGADPDLVGEGEELFGEGPGPRGALLPVTFAAWWLPGATAWTRGALEPGAPDGGERYLVGCLVPEIDFLEQGWDAGVVAGAMENEPLADADLKKVVPGIDVARARAELDAMRYGAGRPWA